jgi:hypothetical protein
LEPKTIECYHGLFQHLRSTLESDEFLQRHRRSERDFTRKRCLTFVVVVLFLLNMVKRALQDELDEFFRALQQDKVAERVVTKSAFTQARQKLKHTAFIELNQEQVAYFYRHFAPQQWRGLRLLAIDGSMCDIPDVPNLRGHFGVWPSPTSTGCAKARLSQLFDVLNKVTVDACIEPNAYGERALAEQHLSLVSEGDLILLDRGYPAYWFFMAIHARGSHFCARLNVNQWKSVKRFVTSEKQEQSITLHPDYRARDKCHKRGLPTDELQLRLIRVDLPTGEVEVLITSLLDTIRFPYEVFKELYFERWPVEEDYKVMKSRLQVENWSGISTEAVYQDFHATVFTKNLAAILAQPAQPVVEQRTSNRKHPYQVNMTNLISKLKDTVVYLFRDADVLHLLTSLWHQMLCTIEPIRPNRSFPREKKVHRKRFPMNYKSTR